MSKEQEMVQELTEKLKAQGVPNVEAKAEEVSEGSEAPEATTVSEMEPVTEEYSEVEAEAMKKGWKPDGPKSAEEFLRAEPLYEEIKQRGKEIKTLRSQVEELMKHVSNLKKAGYEEKLDLIKQERANAVARSDLDSVDYLDEQLYQVKAELQKEDTADQKMHPAATNFVEKYKDLMDDYSLEAMEIKAFIANRDNQLGTYNLDPDIHIKTLEKDMKTKFPNRFAPKETQTEVLAVESDSQPVRAKKRSKGTLSFSDLTQDQKNIYKYMEKKGYKVDEYLKQLSVTQ